MLFENLVVVAAGSYNGSTERPAEADKNGKMPIYLNVLAGKAPNRTTISGTVAERANIEVGNSYLVQCKETEPDEEYGRQFNWNVVSKLNVLEILQAKQTVGKVEIFDAAEVEIEEPVPANENVE